MSLNDRANAAIAALEANVAANTVDTTRFGRFVNQATGYTTTLGQYVRSVIEFQGHLQQQFVQSVIEFQGYLQQQFDSWLESGGINQTHSNTISGAATIPAGRNQVNAGTMTIAVGSSMSVASGSFWSIV